MISRRSGSSAGAIDRQPRWQAVSPRISRRLPAARGPVFQYRDVVGFEWNAYRIAVPHIPPALRGLRILHLSDLHCQPHWQSAYDDLLDRLNANGPDVIPITGDIVDYIPDPEPCLPVANRLLSQLRAPLGIFAVTGNHDENITPGDFAGTPVQFIESQRRLLDHHGAKLELIGIPGPFRGSFTPELEKTFPPKTAGIPRLVLAHYPDLFRRLRKHHPDLVLAGHTHGGQVCLPGMIPLLRHDSLPLKYFHGLHEINRSILVVNRGLGFSTHNVRLFCPAEVIELELTD